MAPGTAGVSGRADIDGVRCARRPEFYPTHKTRARRETPIGYQNHLAIARLAKQSMQVLWRADVPFLLKMVLCVNLNSRCTLFIPEKCYGRMFHYRRTRACLRLTPPSRRVFKTGLAGKIRLIRREI